MTRIDPRMDRNPASMKKDQLRLACRHGVYVTAFVLMAGCQSLAGPFGPGPLGPSDDAGISADTNPVVQVSAEESPDAENPNGQPTADGSVLEKTKKQAKSVMNFMTGKEQEDRVRAKQLYQQGDKLFRQAEAQTKDERKRLFAAAAKVFKKAAEAAPGSALAQDASFMRGESLFFADQLTKATDVYEKLQKEFPRNRHNDRVAARLFAISRYWIDTVKASGDPWYKINLTDSSRPRLDADGHAIRVLDQIRYDDPTGRLADDATMAAAAEYIRLKKFQQADEFLTDLRETFSDSEHLFLAHLLGLRCKLEIYAGPRYSGLVLEEAEKLVRQTRQRFPDKLADPKYGEMVARAAAEIAFHRAERLVYRAEYRENRKEYGAAQFYYQQLLERHGDTPQAETARKRLAKIEKLPAVPEQRLSWLTTIFPESRSAKPVKMTIPNGPPSESGTMLR